MKTDPTCWLVCALYTVLALHAAQAAEPVARPGEALASHQASRAPQPAARPYDTSYIPTSMIGTASGVAPLNTAALVPRANLPTDMLNLATLGAALNGSGSDEAIIQSIYDSSPADSVLAIPTGTRWPALATGNGWSPTKSVAFKSVLWRLLGSLYTASSGTNAACGAIGDGDLTECYAGGTLNFLRHTITGDPGAPAIHIGYENSSPSYGLNGYPFYQGTSALQINAQNDAGATGSVVGEEIELNTLDSHSFQDENVGYSVNVTKHGQGSTWQFSGQTQDDTGLPPQGFASVGTELDILANGPDAPASLYDPGQSDRWFLYLAPKENPTGSWAAATTVATGSLVTAADAAGVSTVYVATAGGKTGPVAPGWPNSGTVTDGTVTWSYGEPYAMSVGAGIWLDNGESGTTSYSAGLATNGRFDDAVLDLSRATLTEAGGSNTGAALRIAANEPIDFSGNGSKAGQNQHFLQYSTANGQNALIYQTPAGTAFSIADTNQAATFAGGLTVGGVAVLGTNSAMGAGANIGNISSGFNASALTVAWNHSNGGQETDLITGQGGVQLFPVSSSGTIGSAVFKLDSSGNETVAGTLSSGAITSAGTISGTVLVDGAGISVAAGTGQATATVLKAQDNVITSCPAGAGVELPVASIGEKVRVLNRGASACAVYPPSGGQIESAVPNAAVMVAAGADATYELFTTKQWYQ